ncbi:MAG TPA: hypothetical protein VEB65_01215 [Solirubrobacterales bacterium]|nr:hypothetical protein [Solirubrobacterales bacterium]
MATAGRQIVAWEQRWFVPVGVVAFLAAILIIASNIVIGGLTNNGHQSDFLVSANEHAGTVALYAGLQAVGFLLLAVPLYFLFRATAARSDRFRRQMVGVVIAAPVFFAIAAILTGIVTTEAADNFVSGDAKPQMTQQEAAKECRDELQDKGKDDFAEEWDEDAGVAPLAECEKLEVEDDRAEHALSSAGLQGLGFGFGLAGRLGFAAAMLYTCLYAMRVGLLSRFWGSLGMALGVASLILAPEFSLVFFIYFGLLAVGKLPGGRPPAWAAGEAIPWPTPGEKAAQEMQPADPDAEVVTAPELSEGGEEGGEAAGEEPDGGDKPNGSGGPSGPRRKRKRRS